MSLDMDTRRSNEELREMLREAKKEKFCGKTFQK